MTDYSIPVANFRIRHKGIFDMEKLYKDSKAWFTAHNFKFREKLHKFKPPELELEWKGERKDTGYRKTEINIKFHLWYHKEQEVKVNGKTKKMTSAAMKIDLNGTLVLDYNNRFDTDFKQWLQRFTEDVILHWKKAITWPDAIHYELLDLHKNMKESLEFSARGGAF